MIYIITLNYNTCKDTIDCLESLKAVLTPFCVVVVDNASAKDDFSLLSDYVEANAGVRLAMHKDEHLVNRGRLFLIRSDSNLGFSGGNNVGIRLAMAQPDFEGVVLLNNDTVVDPKFLQEILSFREKEKEAHLIGGRIFYHDTPDKLSFDGGVFNRYTCKAVHLHENQLISEVGVASEPFETGFITGCLMYISPYCLTTIGLLDESFFMYSEDLDYCIRAQRAGIKLYVVPTSVIWHKVSSSTGGLMSPFSAYWISRNKFRIAKRYLNGFEQASSFMYFWVTRIPRFIKWLLQGHSAVIKAQLKGASDGLRGK